MFVNAHIHIYIYKYINTSTVDKDDYVMSVIKGLLQGVCVSGCSHSVPPLRSSMSLPLDVSEA